MHQQSMDLASEVKRLQRCMNDLVSVLALPAVWSGSEPCRILDVFLDALLAMLDLDFLYVRIRFDSHEAPIDVIRSSESSGLSLSRDEILEAVKQDFEADMRRWPAEQFSRRLGERAVSVFSMRMGVEAN